MVVLVDVAMAIFCFYIARRLKPIPEIRYKIRFDNQMEKTTIKRKTSDFEKSIFRTTLITGIILAILFAAFSVSVCSIASIITLLAFLIVIYSIYSEEGGAMIMWTAILVALLICN